MKHLLTTCITLCLLVALAVPRAEAQDRHSFGIGAKLGTTGIGLEASVPLADNFNARVGGSYFPYSRADEIDDLEVSVAYDAEATIASGRALVDWHPFANQFRFSGGLVYNATKVTAFVEPTESYTVNKKTFEPDRIGTIDANVEYGSKIAPYLGLGVGNAVTKRVAFVLDLGVLYTGSPSVEMEGTGLIAPTAEQDKDLTDGFSDIYLYPVLSLGVSVGI